LNSRHQCQANLEQPALSRSPDLAKNLSYLVMFAGPEWRAGAVLGRRRAPAAGARRKKGRTIPKGGVVYKAHPGEVPVHGYEY
jgi:hypothetical protein